MKAAFVHGYNFNPTQPPDHPDNPTSLYVLWRHMLELDEPEVLPFMYYSAELGKPIKAWSRGKWNSYVLGWSLAEAAGEKLRKEIIANDVEILVGHSLGSRVVLWALDAVEHLPVRKVLLLSGAEHVGKAITVAALRPDVEFLNVWTEADDVLKGLGAWFSPQIGREDCIGQKGLGAEAPPNWHDVGLDLDALKLWGAEHVTGCHLRGDDPHEMGDHKHSYEWSGNWPIYRAFLKDNLRSVDWAAIRSLGKTS